MPAEPIFFEMKQSFLNINSNYLNNLFDISEKRLHFQLYERRKLGGPANRKNCWNMETFARKDVSHG